jgi:AcrR family transcriptional regulator
MAGRRKLSEDRRSQILRAAVETIGERGLCDTRIADVATRAGTSAALLIYYFGTKDRLLAEALAYAEDAFYSQTERELAELETAVDRLIRLIELSCSVGSAKGTKWLDEWVLWLDAWARAPHDPDVARDREAMDRKFRQTIADIVRSGREAGEFRSVDVDEFALRLAALIDGLAIQVVLGDPEVSRERMFDVCVHAAASELGFHWPAKGGRSVGGRRSAKPASAAARRRGPRRAAGSPA